MTARSNSAGARVCVLCGATGATVEHVLPRTLVASWGLNPDAPETAPFRTRLCARSNSAGSSLHARADVIAMINSGVAASQGTLNRLADWSVWVSLMIGVSRDSSVWPRSAALRYLRERFPCGANSPAPSGGLPKGTRVYAALADDATPERSHPRHAIALRDDPRVLLGADGEPTGGSAIEGLALSAGSALRLGSIVTLVIGPTWRSGPTHETNMDEIAGTAGLSRVHPNAVSTPLARQVVDMRSLATLFTTEPFAADTDAALLPRHIRHVRDVFTSSS
jgi:hypothetical protein